MVVSRTLVRTEQGGAAAPLCHKFDIHRRVTLLVTDSPRTHVRVLVVSLYHAPGSYRICMIKIIGFVGGLQAAHLRETQGTSIILSLTIDYTMGNPSIRRPVPSIKYRSTTNRTICRYTEYERREETGSTEGAYDGEAWWVRASVKAILEVSRLFVRGTLNRVLGGKGYKPIHAHVSIILT